MYDAKKDEYYEEELYRDIEVVDRIGSGDAYISGTLYGLLAGGGLHESRTVRQCHQCRKEYDSRGYAYIEFGGKRNHYQGPQPQGAAE